MLTILTRYLPDASPLVFLVLFLVLFLLIVGGSLFLTPRIAKWLEEKEKGSKGYYDGMLEEDPGPPAGPEDSEGSGEAHV